MKYDKLDKVFIPQNNSYILDRWGIQEELCIFDSPNSLKVKEVSLVTPLTKGLIMFEGSKFGNHIFFQVEGDKVKLEFCSDGDSIVKIQYHIKSKLITRLSSLDRLRDEVIFVDKYETVKETKVIRYVFFTYIALMQYVHRFQNDNERLQIKEVKKEMIKKKKKGKAKNRKITKTTNYIVNVSEDILLPTRAIEEILKEKQNELESQHKEVEEQTVSKEIQQIEEETYTVSGYWRTLKNGEKKWIKPYTRRKVSAS